MSDAQQTQDQAVATPSAMSAVRTLMSRGPKSKTVVFGALLILAGALQANLPEFASFLGDHYSAFTSVVGGVVIVLRILTKLPLGDK
jgi:hypothetical protein